MKLRLASSALDGRTVTLTLMQDGVTVGPLTVQSWGTPLKATTGVSVTVEVTRTPLRTAPEGVFFNVTGWTGFETQPGDVAGYDARQMDLIHVWSFGDPGSSYQVPEKLLPEWRDADTARGPYVAHCYETPGDHDWSLTVIEPSTGRIATASGRITVADPDVTFAGARSAYVSQSGDFSDCPAQVPPAQRFTTISAAMSYVGSRLNGGRVMLARGQDFVVSNGDGATGDTLSINGPWQKGPIHVVAGPGNKAKPNLVPPANQSGDRFGAVGYGYRGGEVVISGIDHRGTWDSTTETGGRTGGYLLAGPGAKLFNRCGFYGIDAWSCTPCDWNPVTSSSSGTAEQKREWRTINAAASRFMSHGCVGGTGRNYSLFGTGHARYAFLGCEFANASNARSGGDRAAPYKCNTSGHVRIENADPSWVLVDGCDMFVRMGWPANAPHLWRTQQPCMRFNTNAIPGCFHSVQRSSFEGGNVLLGVMRQNSGEIGTVSPMLVERCILVASHNTAVMIASMGAGTTVRSNLFINPNKPSVTWDFALQSFVTLSHVTRSGGEEFPEIYLPKAEVTGNTFIDLCTTAHAANRYAVVLERRETTNPNRFGKIVVADNIVHRPNRDAPEVEFGPLDKTPLWAPRETQGPIVSWTRVSGTYPARFHRGDRVTVPYPAGTTWETFTAPGMPNPKSWSIGGPPTTIEHTVSAVVLTNIGTTSSHDVAAGASYALELDRTHNPARFPQYATPLDSVWRATPLAGSSAIGGATSDDVPDADLRGRTRPVHPSIGALET